MKWWATVDPLPFLLALIQHLLDGSLKIIFVLLERKYKSSLLLVLTTRPNPWSLWAVTLWGWFPGYATDYHTVTIWCSCDWIYWALIIIDWETHQILASDGWEMCWSLARVGRKKGEKERRNRSQYITEHRLKVSENHSSRMIDLNHSIEVLQCRI